VDKKRQFSQSTAENPGKFVSAKLKTEIRLEKQADKS
jgi:hypothetical protein